VAVSLTGVPLLVLAAAVTVGAVAGTVFGWRRIASQRLAARLVVRTVTVLFTEVLALATVGLVANRVLDIYPSWSALFDEVRAAHVTARPPTALDSWLNGHAKQGARGGLTFTWRPVPEPGWHLAVPPEVVLPAAYFRNPELAFPVVVAAAPAKSGPANGAWDDRKVGDDAVVVPDAVVVYVRPADATGAHSLATVLPAQLQKDLRVVAGNWVLVAVGAQMPAALDALAAPGNPYTAVALVGDGPAAPPAPLLDRVRHLPAGLAALLVTPRPSATFGADGIAVRPRGEGRLAAALAWARDRLPPALAPPVAVPSLAAGGRRGG
jgi:hypothetical protein